MIFTWESAEELSQKELGSECIEHHRGNLVGTRGTTIVNRKADMIGTCWGYKYQKQKSEIGLVVAFKYHYQPKMGIYEGGN